MQKRSRVHSTILDFPTSQVRLTRKGPEPFNSIEKDWVLTSLLFHPHIIALFPRRRVAQLGEHLLCKHAFISPKSLNRRLFTARTLC